MQITIRPRLSLSPEDILLMSERVAATEHVNDGGARPYWNDANLFPKIVVAYIEHESKSVPLGILTTDGPKQETCPTWWIDSRLRGKGYGKPMIDAFAEYLRATGVTGIGRISIQTYLSQCDEQSRKLAKRLRIHFPPKCDA